MTKSGGGGIRSINLLKAVYLMGRFLKFQGQIHDSIVFTPPPPRLSAGRRGVGKLSLQPNFQKGGAWQDLNYYGG